MEGLEVLLGAVGSGAISLRTPLTMSELICSPTRRRRALIGGANIRPLTSPMADGQTQVTYEVHMVRDPVFPDVDPQPFLTRRLIDEMMAELDATTYEQIVGASPPQCGCGDPIPYGARFCIKCGARLQPLPGGLSFDAAELLATINQALGIPATGVTRRLKAQE